MKTINVPTLVAMVISANSLFALPGKVSEVVEVNDDADEIFIDNDTSEDMKIEDKYAIIRKYEPDYSRSSEYYDSLGLEFPLENYNDDLINGKYEKVLENARTVLSALPGDPYAEYCLMMGLYKTEQTAELINRAINFFINHPYDDHAIGLINHLSINRISGFYNQLSKSVQAAINSNVYDPLTTDQFMITNVKSSLDNGYLKDVHALADKITETTTDPETEYYAKDLKTVAYLKMDQPEKALQLLDSYPEEMRNTSWIQNKTIALRNARGVNEALKLEEECLKDVDNESQTYDTFKVKEYYICDLTLAGRYDEAIANVNSIWSEIGEIYELPDGDIRETVDIFDDPLGYVLLIRRGVANLRGGRADEAKADFDKIPEQENIMSLYAIARAYLGDSETAVSIAENLFQWDPAFQASVYYTVGNVDKALEKLSEAYSNNYWTPTSTRYDIHQQGVVNDPRFAGVAAKFNPEGRTLDQR